MSLGSDCFIKAQGNSAKSVLQKGAALARGRGEGVSGNALSQLCGRHNAAGWRRQREAADAGVVHGEHG